MRMSSLFNMTLRNDPAEADVTSHRLLLRAGFINQLASGIFSYLPLAKRSLTKIENIMRDEMNAIGGQEVTMPVVNPAGIWQETGRWQKITTEMGRFKDKNSRDMVLAMTHEEVVGYLVRQVIHSYRQLPCLIYHIQTKWRDDPRPRAGLIRVREFTMKDSYSLDSDWEGLDVQYRNHYQAYYNIYNRCGLPAMAVKSDVGMMGGSVAHEYMYLTPVGEDTILICDACSYASNRQIAKFRKVETPAEDPLAIEKVATPGVTTIEDLAKFMDLPTSKMAKAVLMIATTGVEEKVEKLVFAVIRGDMDVNETKLAAAVKANELRAANDEFLAAAGIVAGYASPIGVKNALVVVDDTIPASFNFVAGANEEGHHFKNVNYGRDFQADIVADIAAAREGDSCIECGKPLKAVRGVEVGNIFKLGTRYSEDMKCYFMDKDDKQKPVIMGSYGIGSGRMLGCIAEEHNDERGLIWPITVAPFQVYLVEIGGKKMDESVLETARNIYEALGALGIEALYDDRKENPGVKFSDADLIGIPIRLTVSERSLKQGGVEYKRRQSSEIIIKSVEEIVDWVKLEIAEMVSDIQKTVVNVAYKE